MRVLHVLETLTLTLSQREREPDRIIGRVSQALIDITTPEGRQSGLHHTSLVNGTTLFTIEQSKVLQRIGSLSPRIMAPVDECLKKALAL